ncbi:hypothetical protein S40285_07547 [Stachybotrys chlorohalonatus IBT 40285]|uniref:SEC7 domain-containing protein n=1 Tax=Stachybotrys chlorohalonatus (strain IBT 40285) TaxID=1283841 RepID=A0A084QFP4_STAC4|nr:hypothetical protein S40285_07547 [Stachybotrys chlorohalonata IBT 40285]
MPLLRRRNNVASESDMRRHSVYVSSPTAPTPADLDSMPPPPMPSQPSISISLDDDDRLNHTPSRNGACEPDQHKQNLDITPPSQNATHDDANKHRRFSLLRFRNASDSQLSLRARLQAEKPPPVPRRRPPNPSNTAQWIGLTYQPAPEIITTSPTGDFTGPKKKTSRLALTPRLRRSHDIPRNETSFINSVHGSEQNGARASMSGERDTPTLAPSDSLETSPLPSQLSAASDGSAPQPHNNRQSESSRSDAASVDRMSQSSPNTTPKRATGTNPFSRFRRRKQPEPMFPLGHLPQKNQGLQPAPSSSSISQASTPRPSSSHSSRMARPSAERTDSSQRTSASPATVLFAPGGTRSGQSSPTRAQFLRGRSSTMSSVGRESNDERLLPPTTRTSSSTGRKSFGDLLGLSRLRQNSDLSRQGTATPVTPGSTTSKPNSMQLTREAVVLPERRDDESPAKYLARIEETVSRRVIAATLSKGSDAFSMAVLRSYMRSFSFFGDPMDMSIRKLLMEAELPKETQHIDRCLQAFANRYHECNPGIFLSPDQAYFIAFSLLILHTDVFNKNNKHKMQKPDYIKNTQGEGIFDDILECFYDNICYTPFIHVEEDFDLNGNRSMSGRTRRTPLLSSAINETTRRATREPIDPYTLILEGNLDSLRPNLGDAMHLDDHFNYLGTASCLNLKDLQKTFFRTGVLQIVSARSRPDAFMTEKTATNPQEAHPGIVDIKVTKVGLLWRKDLKKRRTRSPWQEWGAILTGAQLYFFRNTSWVKNLMHQFENHVRSGHDEMPIIFKPPLEEFKPDALMSTQGAVALLDASYKKHKNAFLYVRPGGLDEVLLADDEDEMNDWLAKLNYAAAFRTSGVKMRAAMSGSLDGHGRRGMRRLDSSEATQMVQTPSGPVSIARGQIDRKMVEEIQSARREFMQKKIEEADQKIEEAQKRLDEQLRNARHLQILAPIQPRTREDLLSAAARIAAQLKWTRMEIWKERCHRDILDQDLAEDNPNSLLKSTPSKERLENDVPASPTSLRQHSIAKRQDSMKSTDLPVEPNNAAVSDTTEAKEEVDSPTDQVFQTPPQTATHVRHASLTNSRSDLVGGRHGSVSSITSSALHSPDSTPQTRRGNLQAKEDKPSAQTDRPSDDVDAEERDLLEQAGLLEAKSQERLDSALPLSSPEATEQGNQVDREKAEKNKIRRSLQRTLREGAGHLHHHRSSRRGREGMAAGTSDEVSQENRLSRGTGSFVVHGKKASVINIGTDLQSMSQEEKMRGRRQSQPSDQIVSPGVDEDDFHSAVDVFVENGRERRGSVASTSTATARSFQELYRKYSTAQAARSTSIGARLRIPSDGESEAAVSFSDGRRSPLPPIETGSDDDEDDRPTTRDGGTDNHAEDGADETDAESIKEQSQIPSRAIQAVNA